MFSDIKKIIMIICLIAITSCNEHSVETPSESPNEINGQIVNWNSAYNDSLFWGVWIDSVEYLQAYTKVSDDGQFKLNLPVPPNEALRNYSPNERDYIVFNTLDSIQFSDTTAKYIRLTLEHYQRITLPVRCGNTNSFGSNVTEGDYQIHYYYFDRPTEVNGNWSVILKDQYYPEYERNIITKYNKVNFNQGWNQIIITLFSLEDDRRIFEVTNENRNLTEWIFEALPNEFVGLL